MSNTRLSGIAFIALTALPLAVSSQPDRKVTPDWVCYGQHLQTPTYSKDAFLGNPADSVIQLRQTEQDTDTRTMVNDTGVPRNFRVCLGRLSFEGEVHSGNSRDSMTKLLTVAGGSCTDVTAPYIAVRYACEDTAAKCQGRKPFTTYVCRDSKNPNIIRERRLHYLHGWAAAHVDFRDRLPPGKTRRGPFAWVHFDAPGRPASLEYSRIVSGNPVTLYRVCEGLRYINIRVDDSAIDVPSNRKCLDVAGKTVDLSLRDKSNAKYAKPQYYILEE